MRNYLLLFASFTLLLFALPKNSSLRGFAQQVALNKSCAYSDNGVKKSCARKCIKHQTHNEQQKNAAGLAVDCSQQVYAVVNALYTAPLPSFRAKHDFILPLIRKHLSPVLEHDPEPPRLS